MVNCRKFLAFDIEIAKILPEGVDDLKAHRPLGICCAAAVAEDDVQPHVWYSCNEDGSPAPRKCRKDASDLVDFLVRQVEKGYTMLTWNGLRFDFDILAEESRRHADCKLFAMKHVDLMFHIFCEKGFRVGLEAAAGALGYEGKTSGTRAAMAPQSWANGDFSRVLSYATNDCRLTLAVATTSEYNQSFSWITQRGTTSSFPLISGWQSVEHAMKSPLPDTSWMSTPPDPRSRFTDWCQ
jgi:hypothetical protein